MGGLLAADAATHPSNNPDQYPGAKPKRIIGVVAFDTPYLGMHPHVVISGIASLLPKGDEPAKAGQSDREMNDQKQVKIVDEKVTDDWEEYKKHLKCAAARFKFFVSTCANSTTNRILSVHPASNSNSSLGVSPPQSIYMPTNSSSRASSPDPIRPFNSPSPLVDRALAYVSKHSDAPIVRWLRTHADDPLSAGKRWVVEHFQFGISMFDPRGLKSRYVHLVEWQGGLWVNYWTQTVPCLVLKQAASGESSKITTQTSMETLLDNDKALLANGMISSGVGDIGLAASEGVIGGKELHRSSIHSPSSQPAEAPMSQLTPQTITKKLKDKHKQEKTQGPKSGKHFIVLPNGLGQVLGGMDKWEQVLIGGVVDEVTAHTGLFIPDRNLDYDRLVERVKARVLGWCENVSRFEETC